ncbi:MAG: class I SAM-dependent methyltransferase [Verrucomicrobium sp.]|nr:class I SAM-dependent methyltransferase [Verrucomicrobium sp.]
MKPAERFTGRAADYRRHRPGYPAGIADLLRECGLPPGARVADIGAGTGLFTRLLLEAGYGAVAVEPNAAMREAAREELPGVEIVAGSAEATGLPDAAFDAVTSAQAFHWFEPEAARREFCRIAKPGGWLFLVWNDWENAEGPFNGAFLDFMGALREVKREAHALAEKTDAAMDGFFASGAAERRFFPNPHVLDWPGLRGRFLSMSYAPREGDPRHEPLLQKLRALFDAHARDGRVTLEQRTEVYFGRLG